MFISLISCTEKEEYLIKDYFDLLSEEIGVIDYTSDNPYFTNIDQNNELFPTIQALVEWDILSVNDKFELDEQLTYKIINMNIANLLKIENHDNILNTQNIINNKYEINTKLYEKEAKIIVDKIKELMNNKSFEINNEVTFNTDVITLYNYHFEQDYLVSDKPLKINDVIVYKVNNEEVFKRVIEKQNNKYLIEEVDILDIIKDMHISNDLNLDFTNAIIEANDVVYEVGEYQLLANLSQQYTIDGYNINWSLVNGRFHVYVSKKSDHLLNYFAEVDIYNINPTYNWNMQDGVLKEAYFKLNYTTLLNSGVSVGKYYDYYSDLKFDTHDDILKSIVNSFKPQDEILEKTITVATVKIPIPNTIIVDIKLKLQLHIYASGKVELAIATDHSKGFEILNNNFRVIDEEKSDVDLNLRASGNAMVGLTVSLDVLNYTLMDIAAKTGIKGLMQTTAHIHNDDSLTSLNVDVPLDLLAIKDKSDILQVCGDLSLYWVLQFELNSKYSLASKLGFNYLYEILDEDNQLFLNQKTHIENFTFIDECTVKNKENIIPLESINPNQIVLNEYSYILKVDEIKLIDILSIPQDYSISDIKINALNPEIISIDNYKITGKNLGNTIIEIKTIDDKYRVQVHVLVSE